MAKKNYDELADKILAAVGTAENITYATHCMTRLRFELKDRSIVDLEEIKKVPGVFGGQWSGEQLQIIIGQTVGDVYDLVCRKGGISRQEAVNEDLDGGEKKTFSVKGLLMGMIDGLSGSLTPLIPALIGAGMIKVICMALNLAHMVPADNSTYTLFTFLGDTGFYFLPVLVGWSSARKFKTSEPLGMMLGASLILPKFMAAISAGTAFTMFGLPVYSGNYSSTIIPTILSVWVLSKVEKLLKKYSPETLRSMLVPTLSLLIVFPITLVVTGPLGFYLGTYVSGAVIWLYEKLGVVGLIVLCAFKPIITMTGMHLALTPYCIQTITSIGYEGFYLPASVVANLNQAAACFAVGLKTKSKDLRSTALSCGTTALVAGISEPAMYGVTIKYKKPMVATFIGGAVAGLTIGLLGSAAYVLPGSTGVFGFLAFIGPDNNLIKMVVGTAVGFVVTFVATWVLGFDEEQ